MIRTSRSPRALRVLARAAALTAAVVALTAASAATASAQGGGQGGQGRGVQQSMLWEGITLTDAQKTKVDSVGAAFREKMMALPRPAEGQRPDSAMMATRRKLTEEQRAAMRSLLTADQQKAFDANIEKMRNMPRGGGRPNGGER